MHAEICQTATSDGIELDGAWFDSPVQAAAPNVVDALLLIHGTGSNFYASGVLATFAQQASAAGVSVLRGNTRGHDGLCSLRTQNGPKPGGAAYEVISECVYDLHAWADFLVEKGCHKIGLVGHSMGAVKSIYTMAQAPHPSIACLIGISPPRFCHARLMSHASAQAFCDDFNTARQLVAAGRGDQLITVRQPLPLVLTAVGFLAKYGPHDDYDEIRHLPNVPCPTLIIIGTQSVATSPAFDGLPQAIQEIADDKSSVALQLVDGANTGYSGCAHRPFELAVEWLSSQPSLNSSI